MPTVIRKSRETLMEVRRDILHAVGWQVRSSIWSPPTDLYETEYAYIIRMEIAGMREEDFEVSLQNDTLSITGSRPDYPERRAYHQMEIRFGKFASFVGLPGPVDIDQSKAEYVDGFLTVTLTKATPTNIKVE
ncbi:MAG TPA: Hsp20/alpha crystallin family protein [Anaerolineales bacterium]|nr:Hsp20/alpha crystallin family protein [Anaerolineales bacterium]HNA87808.1 Hsp20/alpha crystallin family protein [Anaerolineales bacterium]HNC07159.1 Hsp20/alpha crystallin family protein [Anaerolineales bacterium]